MLLQVKDANGETQAIATQAVDTLTDRSGTIESAEDYTVVMEANADRAGWFFQNQADDGTVMTINEIGGDPLEAGIAIPPGGTFPPPGYPITVSEIRVAGTADMPFAAREW